MVIYRKLIVYQLAKDIAIDVYRLTKEIPEFERYGFISQITRSAISVPSNIAEGCGRNSIKEQIHFIEIAFASLLELSCQLEIALELKYINQQDYEKIDNKIRDLSVRLSNYKSSKQT